MFFCESPRESGLSYQFNPGVRNVFPTVAAVESLSFTLQLTLVVMNSSQIENWE